MAYPTPPGYGPARSGDRPRAYGHQPRQYGDQPRAYGEPLDESVYQTLNSPPPAQVRGFYSSLESDPYGGDRYGGPQRIDVHVHNYAPHLRHVSRKSRLAALVLCYFLGLFGVHRFYAGKMGTGVLWLCTLGLFGLGWIVDLVMVAVGAFRDIDGRRISAWGGA